jgi:anti-anti-sigma factor
MVAHVSLLPPKNLFTLTAEQQASAIHISLAGELDLAAVEQLDRELARAEKAGPSLILLDLRQLRFIDSSGLKSILRLNSRCQDNGTAVVLVRGPDVQQVFEITGLDRYLVMIDNPDAASAEAAKLDSVPSWSEDGKDERAAS